MKLGELLSGVGLRRPLEPGLAAVAVEGLEYDSRRVGPGYLFFAFPGSRTDGRQFAAAALERGAVAVASEAEAPAGEERLASHWIQVEHGRHALALAAREFYGRPDERLGLTGITGTNGKTTTAYLIDSILRAAGRVTAMIGTIEYHLAGRSAAGRQYHTRIARPGAAVCGTGRRRAARHVTMEVSSHALALGRVYGLHFHTAVFTNLTRDHLDFHGTMEAYFAAKQLLFAGAGGPPPAFAVLNRDDAYGAARSSCTPRRDVIWYGLGHGSGAARAPHLDRDCRGCASSVQCGKTRVRGGIAADRQDQRVQHSGGVRRGALLRRYRRRRSRGESQS